MNKLISTVFNLSFLTLAVCNIGCSSSNTNTNNSIDTISKKAMVPMKVAAFNDVSILVNVLSRNGIGELKAWRDPMDTGYGSLTEYYQFGNPRSEYGLPNNIAYYLEGNEEQATNLLINLNVNNPNEKRQALAFLSDVTNRTFESLKLDIPQGLLKAVKKGKAFSSNESTFITTFSLDQSKIETWKLQIKSK